MLYSLLEFVSLIDVFMPWMGYHNHACLVADGTTDFVDKRKGSPYQQDGNDESQAFKIIRYSIPDLPQVWWHKILMIEV